MAATVISIGGLFFQAVIIPISISTSKLELSHTASLLESIRKRFEPLAWLSLFVLIGTGLVQMSASPQYDGILSISSKWASALLAKHIAIISMVIVIAAQSWVIQPRINRLMLEVAQSKADSDEIEPLLSRRKALARVNLILALVVLGFTAIARAS
jgi:uncharacterized membrane protein